MKHLSLKISYVVALLLVSSFGYAQLKTPFNVRNQYVVQSYQLSSEQRDGYMRVLNEILQKWEAIKDSKCSPSERKEAERKLQDEFCHDVRAIFPDKQYVLWNRNHRGNLTVRFYKEDLGMDNEQFAKFRTLTRIYTDHKTEISRMNLLEAERSALRAEAFKAYSDGLYDVVSKELADYLIYETQVLNTARTLSKKFTIISENKAIRYAVLKIRYEEDLAKLEMQKLAPKQLRKAKNELADNYEKSLLGFLTNEEYIMCTRFRDKLTDRKFMQEYNLSGAQLSKYKELRKSLAMKELAIKQNKGDKAGKPAKLQAVRAEFEVEMEKLLGAEQFKRWKENLEVKAQKRQERQE